MKLLAPSPTPFPYEDLLLPAQNINAGYNIAREVLSLSDTFNMKLLRALTDRQMVTNAFTTALLKVVKTATPEDLASLPTDYRALRNSIPVQSHLSVVTITLWRLH